MKNFYKTPLVLLVLCLSTSSLFSQKIAEIRHDPLAPRQDSADYDRPNILKTNLAGPVSILYEARVYRRRSIQLSVNRINFSLLGDEDKWFGLTGALKFYISRRPATARRPLPAGFYLSPYVRYLNVRETISGVFSNMKLSEMRHNLFGGGVTAGYQIIFRRGLTLDFFAGGGYLPLRSSRIIYNYSNTYTPEVDAGEYKIDPRLGICIGYAFH